MTEEQYKKLILVLIALLTALSGVGSSGVLRVDKFTETDNDLADARLVAMILNSRDDAIKAFRAEVAAQERDCQKERQLIRDRLTVIEQNQAHCLRSIRQHGLINNGN